MSKTQRQRTSRVRSKPARPKPGKQPPRCVENQPGSILTARAKQNKGLAIAVVIFALALLVRFIYLYESSANPSFNLPLVDSKGYDILARSLLETHTISKRFFWQPFFYPVFLAVVYFFSNSSILAVKIFQAFLGSLTCLLTFRLGQTIFGRRTGIVAGLITAFYGPLIFFEGELLAVTWAAFWAVALVLLFIETAQYKKPRLCFLLGLAGGLSIITRPTFLPFFLIGCLWLAVYARRNAVGWSLLFRNAGIGSLGFLIIVGPVIFAAWRITGYPHPLPSSGGVNLYIGNNPNYCETLTARPSEDWEDIVTLPIRAGVRGDAWARERFFKQQVRKYACTEPIDFIKGIARKATQFVNSREIPRNIDIYVMSHWSVLLRCLSWKAGGFGFPFGVLLPLAIIGLIRHWRKVPPVIVLFLLLYSFSIISVFVSARYRLPVIGILAVLAAAGLLEFVKLARTWRRSIVALCAAIAVILVTTLPGPFYEEQPNMEAEFYRLVADALCEKGQRTNGISYYERAIQLDDNVASTHQNLGQTLLQLGEPNQAANCFSRALAINPDYAQAHTNMGAALLELGQPDKALGHFTEALRLQPEYPDTYYNIGLAKVKQGKFSDAVDYFRQAIRFHPDYNPFNTHYNLAVALLRLGKAQEAIHFNRALHLKPYLEGTHNNLALTLQKQHRFDEAIDHYNEALRLKPNWPEAHNNLATALQEQQRFDQAIVHYIEAIRLQPNYYDAHFNLGSVFLRLGRLDEAIDQYTEVIRLQPNHTAAHLKLGAAFNSLGHFDLAVTHWTESLRLEPDQPLVLNNLAWTLAVYPYEPFHNPSEAVRLAQRACQLTNYQSPELLDTLAMTYAAAARYSDAVSTAQKGIDIALAAGKQQLAETIRRRLNLYQAQKPYRESIRPPDTTNP